MDNDYRKTSGDARKTALFILNTLDHGRKTLDRSLEDLHEKNHFSSKQDRAFLYAILFGVLRWRGRLDWIIKNFSRKRIRKINPGVLNILRIGMFQILYLNSVPVSAAVNTSVEMAKSTGAPWAAGFVNALLRKAAQSHQTVSFPGIDQEPVSALAIHKSFPEWLISRWIERYGVEETSALCNAINTVPPITIRTNTLKTSRKELIKSLENNTKQATYTKYSPEGISFMSPRVPIPEIKAFKAGWFQVQDEAAQLVTRLLSPQPDETILDACAGLGGKTGHMAQIMKNRGKIYAVDKNSAKLSRLKADMKRLAVSIVTTLNYDLHNSLKIESDILFDRVLLDAPCSSLGVIRRNPDIKWTGSKIDSARFAKRQSLFMDNLAQLVKPQGILVYAVCSMEPEENEEVIDKFLTRNQGFEIENISCKNNSEVDLPVSEDKYLKTFPHVHDMDGFFAAVLRRVK